MVEQHQHRPRLWLVALIVLIAISLAGCANLPAARAEEPPGEALCKQASDWDRGSPVPGLQITPTVVEGDAGRAYHFDLGGKGGLQALDANCGWGSYAECIFTARRSDGGTYQFSDLSSFGLWETEGRLYLLYRIVSPKGEADARKRRIVRLGDPPQEVCNQVGDYSRLM
ncbi:hypothetical protein [Xanthomonas sacchari]|uniref:hypothetical protein n=1 Tax=Xanthomonas sacchari TaxID=56458 RepID=UPI0020C44935|nr:hypothetical protein [Xanthomonas sacchari]